MKRTNTADEVMITEIAELRKSGIKNFICTASTDKKMYKPVMKHTAQGISAYANFAYRKYGEAVKVAVGYFDDDCNWKNYCTYSA